MRWHRQLLSGLTLGALLGLTAALARPSGPAAPAVPAAAVEDAEADVVLDRAAGALMPERVAWLECDIRQKVNLPGLRYESEGRYLLAPGFRYRLEVRTRGTPVPGTLLWVSDGASVWQATRAGEGPWDSVSRLSLPDVLDSLRGPGTPPRVRSEFLNGPTFGGVGPLLYTLRTRLMWVAHEAVRDSAAERLVLTAVWPPSVLRDIAPPDHPWPAGLPRVCRLSLNAKSLWPDSVEWWGPGAAGPDVLLARTDYLNPAVNRPLPPEVCSRAFTFDPGTTPVSDRTGQVTADLAARAQQIAESANPR
jgi:hypothetical protein